MGAMRCAASGAATSNASNDALAPLNAHVTAMRFTPERILRTLRKVE